MKPFFSLLILLWVIFSFEPVFGASKNTIAPGDEVHLKIIGILDKHYLVSREGTINFDLMGTVRVAWMTKSQAIQAIKTHLSRYIKFENRAVFLAVNKKLMTEEGNFISVFGEVRNPETYPYKKEYRVLDYIILSGGTTRFALTDSIKIICSSDDRVVNSEFNLQQFSSGVDIKIPEISPGCVIYVPEKPAEKASWMRNRSNQVIHVFGAVNTPGRYEFTAEFSFMDILSHVGGIKENADISTITVISEEQISKFDLGHYLDQGGILPVLKAGDVIFVPMSNRDPWMNTLPSKSIYLLGQVKRPGRYGYEPGFSLLDLLAQAGGPTDDADARQIQIVRKGVTALHFDLVAYQRNSAIDLPLLEGGDLIVLPSRGSVHPIATTRRQVVNLMGEVNKPGRYDLDADDLNLLDLLSAANGPKANADISRIKLIRRAGNDSDKGEGSAKASTQLFDLEKYQSGTDETPPPIIQPGDTILVPQIESSWVKINPEILVNIIGEVNKPGRYKLETEKMNFIDILSAAAGPKTTADISQIRIIRGDASGSQGPPEKTSTAVTLFDLEAFQESGDLAQLPVIQLGDTIIVPKDEISFWEEFKTIGGSLGVVLAVLAILL